MKKEEYDELNSYLNEVFLYLEKYCNYFLEKIVPICKLSDDFCMLTYQYDLNQNNKKKYLTYQDVFFIAREIIISINPEYLKDFDNLLSSGELDFGYGNEYTDSYFENTDNHLMINLKRNFDYSDVITLVHEFIHYTNGKGYKTASRRLFAEFPSIYFEIYAINYLIENGISDNYIDKVDRLRATSFMTADFHDFMTPFISYEKFGSVSIENYEFINKYLMNNLSLETYVSESKNLLNFFKHINEKIVSLNGVESKNEEYAMFFQDFFKYFLGTVLAIYAWKNIDIKDIIYLNEHINDSKYENPEEFLKVLKINLDGDFNDDIINSVESYIEDQNIKLKDEDEEKIYR